MRTGATKATHDRRQEGCPRLVPRAGEPGAGRLPAYCRLPGGRVKIPGRDELRALCLSGRHRECPGYRPLRGWDEGMPAAVRR